MGIPFSGSLRRTFPRAKRKRNQQLFNLTPGSEFLSFVGYLNLSFDSHVDSVCPRYFLMLNDEIIWDWPKDCSAKLNYKEMYLVYRSSASDISDLINVYLNADRQSFIILKDDWELWIFSELLTVELDEDNGTMF